MSAWTRRAETELIALAATGRPFTADDLLARVGPPDPGHAPNGRNSAVGSLFAQWHHRHHIEIVGFAQSTTPSRKGGLIRIWRGSNPTKETGQ